MEISLPDLISYENQFGPEILQSKLCSSKLKGINRHRIQLPRPPKSTEKLFYIILEIQGGYKDGSQWTKVFLTQIFKVPKY